MQSFFFSSKKKFHYEIQNKCILPLSQFQCALTGIYLLVQDFRFTRKKDLAEASVPLP